MSKKDYVLIAGAIKQARIRPDMSSTDKLSIAVSYLALDLAKDNPRFVSSFLDIKKILASGLR